MHPIFLKLGSLTIRWYGVMTAVGFLLGILTAMRLAKKSGLKSDAFVDLGFIAMVAGIVGARLFYVVANWSEFAPRPMEIIRIDHGGQVFYGGFIGAAIAMLAYGYRKKLPKGAYADILAITVPIGHALGRVGCFLNGCCFGSQCDLPWGVTFPKAADSQHFTDVFNQQLKERLVRESAASPLPVHPTQLYEAAGLLALAALMWWCWKRKILQNRLMWVYIGLYGNLRFAVEILRDDEPHWIFHALTNAQAVAILMVFASAVAVVWKKRKDAKAETG